MKHFLQNHLRMLLLAGSTLFLSACSPGGFDPEPTSCSEPYVPHTTITATDIYGEPLADYEVTFDWPSPSGTGKITCTTTSACDLAIGAPSKRELSITVTKEGFEPISLVITIPSYEYWCGNLYTKKYTVILKPLV
jgi:hypothetical protein